MKDFEEQCRLKDKGGGADTGAAQSQKAGRQPCMERILSCYGDALLRMCFMYLRDMQLAEDAVQETFLKVYKNYAGFDGVNEKAWVMRIAANVCKDMLRSAWHRKVNVQEQLDEIPDSGEVYAEEDNTLLTAVMQLKPHYREVILLFYYQDMKIADVAKALGAPESTVSVRLKRAREILKKKLGGWHYGQE